MLPKNAENLNPLELDELGLYETDLVNYLKNFFKHTKEKESYFFLCESKLNKDPNAEKVWHQQHFRVDELDKAIPEIFKGDMTDLYLSTSVHNRRRRTEDTISSIPALIIDLDYYKTIYKELDFGQFINVLEKEVFSTNKIPRPNYVVSSGGGAYLIYNLKYTPKIVLPKRRVVMKIFYELLKEYGSDGKSLDPSHIFRMPNTLNGKNGERRLVRAFASETLSDYTMADISRSLPNLYDVWKTGKQFKPSPEKKITPSRRSKIVPLHKEKTLAYSYIQNIFKLTELRKGDCEGIREMMCFLVRNYYHWMHKDRFEANDESLFEESLKVAYELNEQFSSPLKDSEICSSTLNRDKLYRFKVATFNDWLGISMEEQIQMKLKTKDAKRLKWKLVAREKRGSVTREEYDQQRKQSKEELLNSLKDLVYKNRRLKKKQMAEMLGVSPARISQLLKEI